jgi:putative phosphoesterase
MRLGILSDTHDKSERTRHAVEMLVQAGAELLVHCGDFTSPALLAVCSVLPCYFVFGNNDSDSVSGLRRVAGEVGAVCLEWGGVIELGGKRIGVTHGHMRIEVKRVLAQGPDYLLSGHSHFADDFRDGAVRRINPGALHRAEEYTVALLDLDRDELEFLRVEP